MAGAEKKKRRAYLDSFQKNEEGKYDYTGNVYQFEGNKDQKAELRCILRKLWGLCIVLMGSLIASGCISAPGMDNCFYVLLPYAVAFMGGISVFWALCRLTSGKNPMKEYVYEASVAKIPERVVLTVFCIGVTFAGELIYVCLQGMGKKTAGVCVFMILNLAAAVSALLIRRQIRNMTWKKYGKI